MPSLGSVGGAALASHPDVDKVAFTGSTATGRKAWFIAIDNVMYLDVHPRSWPQLLSQTLRRSFIMIHLSNSTQFTHPVHRFLWNSEANLRTLYLSQPTSTKVSVLILITHVFPPSFPTKSRRYG